MFPPLKRRLLQAVFAETILFALFHMTGNLGKSTERPVPTYGVTLRPSQCGVRTLLLPAVLAYETPGRGDGIDIDESTRAIHHGCR